MIRQQLRIGHFLPAAIGVGATVLGGCGSDAPSHVNQMGPPSSCASIDILPGWARAPFTPGSAAPALTAQAQERITFPKEERRS